MGPAAEDVLATLRETGSAEDRDLDGYLARLVDAADALFGAEGCGVVLGTTRDPLVCRGASGAAARLYSEVAARELAATWVRAGLVKAPALQWPELVDGAGAGRSILGIGLAPSPTSEWFACCWLVFAAVPRRATAAAALSEAFRAFTCATLPAAIAVAASEEADELRLQAIAGERTNLLRELLTGRSDPDSATAALAATEWDVDAARDLALITVRASAAGVDAAALANATRRLHDAAARRLRDVATPVACGSDLVLLVEADDDVAAPDIRQRVLALLEEAVASCVRLQPGVEPLIVLGDVCRGADTYALAYASACDVAAVASKLGKRGAVDIRELGVFRLLLKAAPREELLDYADGVLEPLRSYDRDGGKSLEATLRLYLRQGANQRQTAAAGYLHPNTVAYRLRRVAQVLGRDLGVPETLLELQLAFKIDDLRTALG